MRQVTVTLTLVDPTGANGEREVNLTEALSELVGWEISDTEGYVVEVYKVEQGLGGDAY